jgi:hypothetical protein
MLLAPPRRRPALRRQRRHAYRHCLPPADCQARVLQDKAQNHRSFTRHALKSCINSRRVRVPCDEVLLWRSEMQTARRSAPRARSTAEEQFHHLVQFRFRHSNST